MILREFRAKTRGVPRLKNEQSLVIEGAENFEKDPF